MKAEFDKFYLLDNTKYYWCIDLQREVNFKDKLVVKCISTYQDKIYFGKLVNTSEIYDDRITENGIEFSGDDIIKEYDSNNKDKLLFVDYVKLNPGHAPITKGKRSPEKD